MKEVNSGQSRGISFRSRTADGEEAATPALVADSRFPVLDSRESFVCPLR